MGERPASCYRPIKNRAYTRTAKKVVDKAYVRGVPASKIHQFDQGKAGKPYKYSVELVADEAAQVRSQALEACRVVIGREVTAAIGDENAHFQVRAYPHHVLRENSMISGAGADRLQTGMRHSFGRPKGVAARVWPGHILYSIKVFTPEHVEVARRAMKRVKSKLPMPVSIQVRTLA
jgi:large subunit ribosomal protein L10e